MPDDPKAGTVSGDPSATPEGATGTTAGAGGEQETAEQKAVREANEKLAAAEKKYEDEHRLRLSHEQKVREFNAQERGGSRATDDPLDAEIAELEAAEAQYRANNVNDPATRSALRRAYAERDHRDRRERESQRIAQAQQEMESVPAEYRERVWQLWKSGLYWNVEAALQAAKGAEADELRKKLAERETKEREAEVLRRQEAAPGSVRGGGGGGPTIANKKPLTQYLAEMERLQKAGDKAGAAKLAREKDSGVFEIDYAS